MDVELDGEAVEILGWVHKQASRELSVSAESQQVRHLRVGQQVVDKRWIATSDAQKHRRRNAEG